MISTDSFFSSYHSPLTTIPRSPQSMSRSKIDSDDDAWGIDSDDEMPKFNRQSSQAKQAAPPARPHPPHLNSSGSLPSGSRTTKSTTTDSQKANTSSISNATTDSNQSRASWTIVDSNPIPNQQSSQSNPASNSNSNSTSRSDPRSISTDLKNKDSLNQEQTFAGSPPTNLGSSAVAAIYQAANSGATNSNPNKSRGGDIDDEDSNLEKSERNGRHRKGKESESEALKGAVRADWEGVVTGESRLHFRVRSIDRNL